MPEQPLECPWCGERANICEETLHEQTWFYWECVDTLDYDNEGNQLCNAQGPLCATEEEAIASLAGPKSSADLLSKAELLREIPICTCGPAYKDRGMTSPNCVRCEVEAAMAVCEEVQDQRRTMSKPSGPGKYRVTLDVEVRRLGHKPGILTACAQISDQWPHALEWYPLEACHGEWEEVEE